MPFASVSELPAAVRDRLSAAKQRQWLRVWNSVFEREREDGATVADAEAAAFIQANGVVKRGDPVEFKKFVPIEKVDEELRIVWGWAYVCEEDGHQVVDHSGQVVDWQEVQKAAHGFNLNSRRGGVMHEDEAGVIVDTMFFSPEVQKALDIDCGKVGWFVGFRVDDDDAWAKVKSGELRMFSIGGFSEVETL